MNAYAHRDWERGGAVMVEIFNDAVEIISPGWFVEGQDPDEHLSGKSVSPKSRNQLIAQTLFKSGDIESQGTGIKRIKDFCDEVGMDVEYVRTPDGTKLIFHRNDAFGQSLTVGDKVSADTKDDTINDTLFGTIRLSERAERALHVVCESPEATAEGISKATGMSLSTAKRALKELQETEIIYREGSRKTGRWVVRNDGKTAR